MRKQWTKEELIAFEDHIGDLYMDNQLPFLFHLSGGNEDQLIEIFKDIKEGDSFQFMIGNKKRIKLTSFLNYCAVCDAYSQVPKKYLSITVIEN